MIAFLFPGQGAQSRGMGGALFDSVKEYALVEAEINKVLGYSVRQLCEHGTESMLKQTRYTQPCLFVVNALHYYDGLAKHGRPAALAGHSLGEYNALMAGGAFDMVTGVRLVARRAELMSCAASGAMGAVIKLPAERVVEVLHNEGITDVDVANYNAPIQTVIAGPGSSLAGAAKVFERQGASYIPLSVSAPFHSRYMTPVAEQFARFMESFSFNALGIPVISNATGQFYPQGEPTSVIRSLLTRQITDPVLWMDGIRHLHNIGVTSLIETGPGSVLTRLNHQIIPAAAHAPAFAQA